MTKSAINMERAKGLIEGFDFLSGGTNLYFRFLLNHGEAFTYQSKPVRYRWGQMKQCFRNAAVLAITYPELTYVEGYASSVIPMPHAWVIDANGLVIDNTWRTLHTEKPDYFGVRFATAYLRRRLLGQGVYGLLDAPHSEDLLLGKDNDWKP